MNLNTIATIDDLTIEQGSDNPCADLGYWKQPAPLNSELPDRRAT